MSYTNLLYHIVYATKERAPLITKTLRPRLHEYLGGTVRGLGGIALEIDGTADHVHVLAKLRPTISVSEFLSKLKSGSSGWAKRQTAGRFGWQARFAAFTVSESQVERVRRYIRNQEEHWAYADFEKVANLVEELICHLAENISGSLQIEHKDADGNVTRTINLTRPWRRARYRDLIREIDPEWFNYTSEKRRERCAELGVEINPRMADYE